MSWERSIDARALRVATYDLSPIDISNAEADGARLAWRLMRSVWPVATGTSLAGWEVEKRDNEWWLVNRVDYAEFVHIQEEYGGPPGLADRRWEEIQPEIRSEVENTIARIQSIRASKALMGRARGRQPGERLRIQRPAEPDRSPAPRRIVDPVDGTRVFAAPARTIDLASGLPSAAGTPVVSRAAARATESVMRSYVVTGQIDSTGLSLIRAGRLQDAYTHLQAIGSHAAASRLRDIINRGQTNG